MFAGGAVVTPALLSFPQEPITMGDSLRDQLLKAGLATEKQAKQAKKHQHSERVAGAKGKPPSPDEGKAAAAAAAAQKAERDRQLNKQRQEAEERKAIAAQVRQLVEAHRQPRGSDDVPYNFTHHNLIKRIYVSEEVHKRIASGALVIVRCAGKYELVPADVADKIRQRDAAAVVVHNEPQPAAVDADDPYAKFTVPDDLMW